MKGDGIMTLGGLINAGNDASALNELCFQSPRDIYQEFLSKALQYPCIWSSPFESLLGVIQDQNIEIDTGVYASLWSDFSFRYLNALFKIINTGDLGIEKILICDGDGVEVKPFEYTAGLEEKQKEDMLQNIQDLYKTILSTVKTVMYEIEYTLKSSETRMLFLRLNELVPAAAELSAYCFVVRMSPDFSQISKKIITERQRGAPGN